MKAVAGANANAVAGLADPQLPGEPHAMSLLSDLKIIYHMALSPIRGGTHAERLESFYGSQAEGYDDFRRRLLKGREGLYRSIQPGPNAVWVDMGGGTGANLEHLAPRMGSLRRAYVVDLSKSLLGVARRRAQQRGWNNVSIVEADATTFTPDEGQADVVTFSYSLTMIPDWFRAVENARRILKPGGTIGVVDFYVARKYPDRDCRTHPWATRAFWPVWFASDNVFLSPDHLPYLRAHFLQSMLAERRAKVPYLPLVRAPYYQFIGRKAAP